MPLLHLDRKRSRSATLTKTWDEPVVMLSSGITPTAGMLPVLANTTVTVGHVTTQLPGLLLAGGHRTICNKNEQINF